MQISYWGDIKGLRRTGLILSAVRHENQTEENTGGSATGRGAVLTRYWSRRVYARWVKAGRRPRCKGWGFGRWTSEKPSLQRNSHPTPRSMFSLLSPYENPSRCENKSFLPPFSFYLIPIGEYYWTSLISSGYAHFNGAAADLDLKERDSHSRSSPPYHETDWDGNARPCIPFNLYSSTPTTLATRQLNSGLVIPVITSASLFSWGQFTH